MTSIGTSKQKLKVTLTEQEDGTYRLSWQDRTNVQAPFTDRIVTLEEVQSEFPEFCEAIAQCHSDLNPAMNVEQLIMCAAYTYA